MLRNTLAGSKTVVSISRNHPVISDITVDGFPLHFSIKGKVPFVHSADAVGLFNLSPVEQEEEEVLLV